VAEKIQDGRALAYFVSNDVGPILFIVYRVELFRHVCDDFSRFCLRPNSALLSPGSQYEFIEAAIVERMAFKPRFWT